jgi:hypothetical protein
MPRQSGTKSRSSLRTALPHQNHYKPMSEATIGSRRKFRERSGGAFVTVLKSFLVSAANPFQPMRHGQQGDLIAKVIN